MRIIFVVLVLFSLIGCASVHYTAPGGEKFDYSRLGIQKIENFAMTKDEKGIINLSFAKQEGSEGQLIEALKNITQVAAQIATKAP